MIRMRYLQAVFLAAAVLAAGAAWAGQDKPLDNAEIIKLQKADMGDVVIIAKIRSAPSVNFATGTDDLVKLKQAGVGKDVIAAMLDRANSGGGAASSGGSGAATAALANVTLVTTTGAVPLKSIEGDVKTIVAPFVGVRRFVEFDKIEATTRTKDTRPSVTVAIDKDPRKVYWFVKLDQDKDKDDMNRSMDVESHGLFGGVLTSAPDSDSQVKTDVVQERPGVWKLTPTRALRPGEYGVYVGKSEGAAYLFDFGVDK
jgi:hypothetical protein